MLMILLDVFAWWYTAGWARLVNRITQRVQDVMDFFSIGLLFRTLFDPFRQIDAGSVKGSLNDQMHAFGNRLVSRIIGAAVRTITIFSGLVIAALLIIFGLVQLLLWPLVPFLPIIGLVLTITRFLP